MKTSFRISLLSLIILGSVLVGNAASIFTLSPLTSFGFNGDGTIRPGDSIGVLTFDGGFNQRGLACDPLSTNLVLVDTHSGSGGGSAVTGNVYVITGQFGSAATPATLLTNGIIGGNYADVATAIADDGVVFICNQVSVSTNNAFKIYRYQGVADPNPPIVAFSNTIAPSQRYGESISIRGTGAGTQILLGSMLGSTATNVVLFTTTDGTNFTANSIGVTNVITGGLGQFSDAGIAFGPTNTFWAKSVTAPLRYLSYNLAAKTATILASYNSTNLPGFANLGPLAVNTNLNVMAAIEEAGGNVNGGPERVWLFDISGGGLVAPSLLSIQAFGTNNQNATAPLGYLGFGVPVFGEAGTPLYASVVNNGLLALNVGSTTTPLPIIDQQPVNPTNTVAIGQTAHWQVLAYPAITGYQWKTNGVPIPGATNYSLDVPNVQTTDSGVVYSVDVINAAGTTTSANSTLSVIDPATLFHLNLLWSFAANGTNYITNPNGTTVPDERSIAYDSVSNHVIVVRRNGTSINMYVVDPNTGQFLYLMNTNGLALTNAGINIPLLFVGVADDGAVYACNGNSGAGTAAQFRIYRWANSGINSYPTNIWQGNPAVGVTTSTDFRWGDAMSVSGSGASTKLVVDNQDVGTFHYAAVLTPSGADLNQPWNSKGFILQNTAGGTGIGRTLQFGPEGNTFWQKRYIAGGAPVVKSDFNLSDSDPAVALVETSSSGLPLFTNGPVGFNFTFNLAAAVNFVAAPNGTASVPDTLELYDFSNPQSPVRLNAYNFAANQVRNDNTIVDVVFATNSVLGTNYVFALNANNGLMGLTLATGPLPPPHILTQPRNQRSVVGNNVSLSVVFDVPTTNQWQKDSGGNVFTNIPSATNTIISVNNAQVPNSGNYRVYGGNPAGAATSIVATVTITPASNNFSLAQIWSTNAGFASTDGGPNTPKERSLAYNALSNQLIVVRGVVNGSPNPTAPEVHVIDANTGVELYTMDVSGVPTGTTSELSGSNPLNLTCVAVADDGNVYACNETPNASGGVAFSDAKTLRVYRWTNSGPTAMAVQVFEGDPSVLPPINNGINLRFGDVMTVRGSGMNTEILLDDQSLGVGAGILRPADATLNTFTNIPVVIANGGGSIGRSIQFVGPHSANYLIPSMSSATNFWQKRKSANLNLTTYDTNSDTGILATNFVNFPTTLGGVAIDQNRNLAIGVDFTGNGTSTPDQVGLYEISDPTTPMLIARYNFPTPASIANVNFIASTVIGGNKVFSLDGNNGIVAFTLVPAIKILSSNPNLVLSWENLAGFTLQAAPSLVTPITWTNVTTGTLVSGRFYATNSISGSSLFYRLSSTLGH